MGIKERIFFLWWGLLAKLVGLKPSVSGMALHDTGEYISDQIRRTGHYYELPNLLKVALVCRVKHFVDVGANIGNHTRFFASLSAKGVAFEPSSGNFQLLKKMPRVLISITSLSARVRGVQPYLPTLTPWATID